MAYEIVREDVWVGEVEDRPGGLADKLEPLSDVGVDLEFMIARRAHEKPGTTVLFLAPVQGEEATRAAGRVGLYKWSTAASLRIEGPNRPGLAAMVARTVGNAGVNMRGLAGARLSDRAQVHIAFDSGADADKASQALAGALNG